MTETQTGPMTDTPDALPALADADWSRILCVVAHPDDMEYGMSAAVAHWTRQGKTVAYLLLTAGEAGMQLPPGEVRPLRAEEQQRACACVGVDNLRILNHPDGTLTYNLELRRDVARMVREFRPDAVITANYDVEAYGGLNQADHRAAGLATIDGVRDADNTWIFPELIEEGLPKWHARALLVGGHPAPTHGVVVDADAAARSIESLQCHEAYLADLPNHPEPADFIGRVLREGGEAMGEEYAVLFRVFDLGGLAGA